MISQVVNLQAQLASLKEQAAHQNLQNGSNYASPNYEKFQDLQSWFHQSENSNTNMPQFDSSLTSNNIGSTPYYGSHENMTSTNYHMGSYENMMLPKENMSSFEEGSCSIDSYDMQTDHHNSRWTFQDDGDDLQSVAFRYLQHS